jgi:hypothetical protein
MDETQISITIRPIYIERLIYWIIILVLAVLLVIAWTKDETKTTSTTSTGTTQQNAQAPPTQPTQQPSSDTPKATCSDALKNQDESDVDCGGSCSVKCVSGKSCKSNTDCISNICTNSICTTTAPAQLSGNVQFTISNVAILKNPNSSQVKVTGISYKINNGLSDDLNLKVIVYIQDKNGIRCLDQESGVTTCDKNFAIINVGRVASGKTASEAHLLQKEEYTSSSYVTDINNYYHAGDKFTIYAKLDDGSGQETVNGKAITTSFMVSP